MKRIVVLLGCLVIASCRSGDTLQSARSALDAALVAGYNFDEGAGSALHDVTTNHLDGVVTAHQTWATGKYGGALAFDGAGLITVADPGTGSPLDLSTGLTISAWIAPDGTGGSWQDVVSKGRPSALAYGLYGWNSTQPLARIASASDVDLAAGTMPAAGQWTYVAMTYDHATLRLFEATAGTVSQVGSKASAISIVQTNDALTIGGNAVFGDFFHGRVDDLRIYKRALALAELQTDASTPLVAGGGGAGGAAGSVGGSAGGSVVGAGGSVGGAAGGSAGGSVGGGTAGVAGVGTGGVVTCGSTGGSMGTGGSAGAGGSAGTGGAGGVGGSAGTGGVACTSWPVEPYFTAAVPYVRVMTPVAGMTYFAPATIRIWAHAPDYGSDGVNNYSPDVDIYLGSTLVSSVHATTSSPYDYYQVDVTGVAAGTYDVYARSRMASGTVESQYVPITVVDVGPHAGPNMDLASDLVLSGSTDFEFIGSPGARALLTSSNGSRIRSATGWTGHLILRNVDVIGLGSMDVSSIAVDVVGTAPLEVSGSVFDRTGPLALGAEGSAPITFSGNTLAANILTTVNATPDYDGSHPSLTLSGNSTGAKTFSGNNVGVSFVRFDATSGWLVGGSTSAAGNVLIGVRAGLEFDDSSSDVISGNVVYHRYPYGWSQGHVVDFVNTFSQAPSLLEHNLLRGGSWMIQDLAGEARFNLMVDGLSEAFLRGAQNASVHHNVLANVGFASPYYPSGGITLSTGSFYNNTVDAGGALLGWHYSPFAPGNGWQLTSARNNLFVGFDFWNPVAVFGPGSVASADYNGFWNPDTTLLTPYADTGLGAHDIGGGASTDPQFAQARQVPFAYADGAIWSRCTTVAQVLAAYRAMYTPTAGSPVIDSGDPADDVGARNTDVGAVGAGNPHPADLFGTFGP